MPARVLCDVSTSVTRAFTPDDVPHVTDTKLDASLASNRAHVLYVQHLCDTVCMRANNYEAWVEL